MVVSSFVTVPVEEAAYGYIHTKPALAQTALAAETPPWKKREIRKGITGKDTENVEMVVRDYFKDVPILVSIARCESTFRHTLADGTILRGVVDGADTGVMQINLRYHGKRAKSLGYDLQDLHDNMAYARHLYEAQGTVPWNASAPCWQKTLALR